ncbi:MAG TPA: hypothetical protein PKA05_13710, partial [Roseiflexaceae bacterium]|nr:hypothetical protein [Roseiflexaceae bacterium]
QPAADAPPPLTPTPTADGESIPDWLRGLEDQPAADVPPPVTPTPAADSESIPDWLRGLEDQPAAPTEESTPPDAETTTSEDEGDRWFGRIDDDEVRRVMEEGVEEEVEPEVTPFSLADLNLPGDSMPPAAGVRLDQLSSSNDENEMPAWLAGIGCDTTRRTCSTHRAGSTYDSNVRRLSRCPGLAACRRAYFRYTAGRRSEASRHCR